MLFLNMAVQYWSLNWLDIQADSIFNVNAYNIVLTQAEYIILNSNRTPNISSFLAKYEASIVGIFKKIALVLAASHCI